jgi:hypothetical protein
VAGSGQHPLTLRPTGLRNSAAFADLADFAVYEDGEPIGRIYEQHAPAFPDQAWFWSITAYVDPALGSVTSGRAASLDDAKAAFLANSARNAAQFFAKC